MPREGESLAPELLCRVEICLEEGEIAGFAECAHASEGWSSGSRGERSREPLASFEILTSPVPVEAKPPGQVKRLLGFKRERGVERAAEIVSLLVELPKLVLADLAALVDVLREGEVEREVTSCESRRRRMLLSSSDCRASGSASATSSAAS